LVQNPKKKQAKNITIFLSILDGNSFIPEGFLEAFVASTEKQK